MWDKKVVLFEYSFANFNEQKLNFASKKVIVTITRYGRPFKNFFNKFFVRRFYKMVIKIESILNFNLQVFNVLSLKSYGRTRLTTKVYQYFIKHSFLFFLFLSI